MADFGPLPHLGWWATYWSSSTAGSADCCPLIMPHSMDYDYDLPPYYDNYTNLLEVDEKQYLRYLALQAAASSKCLLLEKIGVRRLRRKDIHRASQTLSDATVHDPLERYTRDTPDARDPRLYDRVQRIQFALALAQGKERWLTVNHGRAVAYNMPAPKALKKSKKTDGFYRLAIRILNLIGKSKLQRRRFDEATKQLNKFTEETLGEAMKEMRSVNALATAPDFQRGGYGGALVDAITKMADAEGRSTYLLSSNPANTEFYNSHGFFTIAEVLIGADDPTWTRPPIPIPLMVRIYGDQ